LPAVCGRKKEKKKGRGKGVDRISSFLLLRSSAAASGKGEEKEEKKKNRRKEEKERRKKRVCSPIRKNRCERVEKKRKDSSFLFLDRAGRKKGWKVGKKGRGEWLLPPFL